jgi:Trk K+ transport system NAD-binding subunit
VKRRLRYLLERVVTRPGMLMLVFAVACLFFIAVVAALTYALTPADARDVAQIVWRSMRHVIDPGATEDDEDYDWPYRLVMLLTAIGGIFVIGAVVTVLTSALYNRIELVRRGRTPVSLSGHTVVLGWSSQIYTILDELARAPGRRPRVVILADDLSKEEMEDAIRRRPQRKPGPKDGKIKKVRVICRHGDPTKIEDLDIAGVDTAEEILVPRPLGPDPDIRVLMTLLALSHRPWATQRRPVAAVISSTANYEAARRALQGWPADRCHVANAEELTARLIVQSRRHPGLTVVCSELVSFAGAEIYPAPKLRQPMTYEEALLRFESSLVGFRRPGDPKPTINPPPDTMMQPGDVPLVVAADATDVRIIGAPPVPQWDRMVEPPPSRPPRAEKTLILGWNDRIPTIIQVLDGYVGPGSELVIIGPGYNKSELPATTNLQTLRGYDADPTDAGVLLAAHEEEDYERPAADPEAQGLIPVDPRQYDSVIVLAGEEVDNHVDAKALTTLLLLQAIKDERGGEFSVICELEEEASRRLAWGIRADDLVLGQQVVSTLAVHYAKNPGRLDMITVVEEWLDFQHSDLYLEPASDYVQVGAPVTWATVVAAAARRRQTAIGYIVYAERFAEEKGYGVYLNPAKSSLRTYHEHDQIVVIANRSDRDGGSA